MHAVAARPRRSDGGGEPGAGAGIRSGSRPPTSTATRQTRRARRPGTARGELGAGRIPGTSPCRAHCGCCRSAGWGRAAARSPGTHTAGSTRSWTAGWTHSSTPNARATSRGHRRPDRRRAGGDQAEQQVQAGEQRAEVGPHGRRRRRGRPALGADVDMPAGTRLGKPVRRQPRQPPGEGARGAVNIGAEGQVYLGALAAAVVGAYLGRCSPACTAALPGRRRARRRSGPGGLGWLRAHWGWTRCCPPAVQLRVDPAVCVLANGPLRDPTRRAQHPQCARHGDVPGDPAAHRAHAALFLVVGSRVCLVAVERSVAGYAGG